MSDFFSQLSSFSINELSIRIYDDRGDKQDLNIKHIMEKLVIYENIISTVITGSILVTDTIGLSTILASGSCFLVMDISKISKEENASISSYIKTFRIFKQTKRQARTENSEVHTFHFCSDEYILSQQSFVGRGYSDTYSNIAKNILQDFLSLNRNEMVISDSFGVKNVVIPSLNPLDALQWCASRAVNKKNIPDFLSFENRIGYNFVSLNDLYKNEAVEINFSIKNTSFDDDDKYFSVKDSTITSQFNLIQSIKKGAYASTIYGYDIITRTFFKQKINASYYDSRMNTLNVEKLIPSISNKKGVLSESANDSKRTILVTDSQFRESKYASSKTPSAKLHEPEYSLAHRSSIFSFLTNKKMKVLLPGNLNLTVGMIVNMNYPKRGLKSGTDVHDLSFSGKHLIIAVKHSFEYDKYETVLEICSDSDATHT